MTLPGLGVMSLSDLEHPALLLFAVVPAAVIAPYLVAQFRSRRRLRRFGGPQAGLAAPEALSRWRHLPIALLVTALLLLTVALAGPTRDVAQPRNRAVIMLVIDQSQSMGAGDVAPNRLAAAADAAKKFARQLTPGVNLGLLAFAGTADLLVSPTPNHQATVDALDHLRTEDRTATGEAILAALQAITTVSNVIDDGTGDPAPARIVLLSDGKETTPDNPNNPRGAYTAARTAKAHGVPISTIAFGTPNGSVVVGGHRYPVPVDEEMMRQIAELSGGKFSAATNVDAFRPTLHKQRDDAAAKGQLGRTKVFDGLLARLDQDVS